MYKGYKTEIDPTAQQRLKLYQICGTARFAYNWALNRSQEHYKETGEFLRFNDLDREMRIMRKMPGNEWMWDIPVAVFVASIFDLNRAYQMFFRRLKAGVDNPGFPKFKAKGQSSTSARAYTGAKIEGEERQKVYFPKLGWLRVKERGYLPTEHRIVHAGVSCKGGRWFFSVLVEVPDEAPPPPPTGEPIGVDLGINLLLACSDGTTFANPKAAARYAKRMKRLQRKIGRQTMGSANRSKTIRRLGKEHYKVSCVRDDARHKATTEIARKGASVVVLENLNVSGMMKNRHLREAVKDASLRRVRTVLTYKVEARGGRILIADRFFPSSQMCSACGERGPKLPLSQRTFTCRSCGYSDNRDTNAAKNLARLAHG